MNIIPEVLTIHDYYIKWRITYSCQYHCPYCIQFRNNCQRRHNEQPYDRMLVANKIANMIRPNTLVELVGGEISIVNEIPEITSLFKSKGAVLKCLTNFSRNWEFYKYFDEIRASFHPSECNMEEFEDKLLKLKANGTTVGTEVVISTKSTDEDNQKKMDFAKWCKDNDIMCTIDTDRFDEKVMSLRPSPLQHHSYYYVDGEKTDKKAFLDENGMFESYGCDCYIGVNSQYIILDKITLCNDNEHKEFKWYDKPQKCKYGHCGNATCMSFRIEK